MKRAILGFLVVVGIVMAAAAVAQQRGEGYAQRMAATPGSQAPGAVAGTELIVVPALLGEKVQMLTVVDPRQHVVCVYHIELATGEITLKSARNIHWDLQINDLNNKGLLPHEIRANAQSEQK